VNGSANEKRVCKNVTVDLDLKHLLWDQLLKFGAFYVEAARKIYTLCLLISVVNSKVHFDTLQQ